MVVLLDHFGLSVLLTTLIRISHGEKENIYFRKRENKAKENTDVKIEIGREIFVSTLYIYIYIYMCV